MLRRLEKRPSIAIFLFMHAFCLAFPLPSRSMLGSPRRVKRKDSQLKLIIAHSGEGVGEESEGKVKLSNLPKIFGDDSVLEGCCFLCHFFTSRS